MKLHVHLLALAVSDVLHVILTFAKESQAF